MNWPTFILGAICGAGVAGVGVVAHAGYSALDEGIGQTHQSDEMAQLRGESDILRLIALDSLKGTSEAESRQMLERLGVFAFDKPSENQLVAGLPAGPGQIVIEIRNGTVSNILNYCARVGVSCPAPGVTN